MEVRVSGTGSGSVLLLKRPEQSTVQPGTWDNEHLRDDRAVPWDLGKLSSGLRREPGPGMADRESFMRAE